jgi:uncharacterized protein YukE
MSQLATDDVRMRELAHELTSGAKRWRDEAEKLDDALRRLGGRWIDEQFDEFERSMADMSRTAVEFQAETVRWGAMLEDKADRLERFRKTGK